MFDVWVGRWIRINEKRLPNRLIPQVSDSVGVFSEFRAINLKSCSTISCSELFYRQIYSPFIILIKNIETIVSITKLETENVSGCLNIISYFEKPYFLKFWDIGLKFFWNLIFFNCRVKIDEYFKALEDSISMVLP